jgi:hypothetical protein
MSASETVMNLSLTFAAVFAMIGVVFHAQWAFAVTLAFSFVMLVDLVWVAMRRVRNY